MIKINTLTEEQIDKIKINEIDLNSRVKKYLAFKDIRTLMELKIFVQQKGINGLYRINGFGSVSRNIVIKLLNHAYPNLKVSHTTTTKYTFN